MVIYTKLTSADKFDEIQDLVYKLTQIVGSYYDTKEAIKMRLEIERFLLLHENQDWHKTLNKSRTFEE